MFHESDIGLNQPRRNLVVAQARPGIQRADILEPRLHRFDWTPDGARNFLELLQRDRSQMLIDDSHRVSHNLLGQSTTVSVQLQLLQMVAQLIEQAFAQVATGDALRIELAHNFQRFVQIDRVKFTDAIRAGAPLSARCSVAAVPWLAAHRQPNLGCLKLGCHLRANLWLSIRLNKRLSSGAFRYQLREAVVFCSEVLGRDGRKIGSIRIGSIRARSFEVRGFGRLLGDSKPQRLRVTNDLGRHFHICLGSRDRSDSQQFFVAGNQVSFFVQISNDQLGGLVHRRPHRNRAQLP